MLCDHSQKGQLHLNRSILKRKMINRPIRELRHTVKITLKLLATKKLSTFPRVVPQWPLFKFLFENEVLGTSEIFYIFLFRSLHRSTKFSFKVLMLFELFRIVIKMPPLYPRTSLSNNKSTDLNKGHLIWIFSRHSYGIYSVTSLRTCKAYPEGENSSFVFTCNVSTVPPYYQLV